MELFQLFLKIILFRLEETNSYLDWVSVPNNSK